MHIDSYDFGSFIVDGEQFHHDFKLVGDKVKLWKNHHLCLDDVKDAVAEKPHTIIIGTGASGVVQVTIDIVQYIESNSIKLVIEKTEKACIEYNKLTAQGKKVAAVLHSTC